MRIKYVGVGLILFLGGFVLRSEASASGIAREVEVGSGVFQNGNLICLVGGQYVLCDEEYQDAMVGVVSDLPEMQVERDSIQGGALVVSQGETEVSMSAANGAVAVGDVVTSSEVPGMAMKATENGKVLGRAMGNLEQGEGLVPVLVQIQTTTQFRQGSGNLLSLIRNATLAPILDPLSSFRYLVAAGLVLVAFLLGFIYFGRMSRAGVEALGRNPLAAKQIQFNVIINSLVTIMIMLVGFGSAYLVLIL